ncbi:MAG: molecular chaperone HtpG, partial [Oscillospiraceae bacterium]|nr:molecular chaperone HtpG [Oscillospiraceae bacterium]
VQTLMKYGEKEFCSILSDDLGLATEEEKKAAAEQTEKAKQTLDFVREALGDAVSEVRLSTNLGNSPVCLVPGEGMSFEMEKYFRRMNPDMPMKAGRVLEFNAEHPVFGALQIAVAQDAEKAKKYASILYTQAVMMAGLTVDDPMAHTELICELMK